MYTISHYHYTEQEIKQILKSITILVDTREQKNDHILTYLKGKSITYKSYKLDFGDYSAMIPANKELGIVRDIYFDKQIIIERKNSLEELSQNLAQHRERFESEWLRAKDCRKILLIERGSYEDIFNNAYGTNFKPASYFGSLLSFQHRYGLNITFMGKEYSAQYIYGTFYYFLREQLG